MCVSSRDRSFSVVHFTVFHCRIRHFSLVCFFIGSCTKLFFCMFISFLLFRRFVHRVVFTCGECNRTMFTNEKCFWLSSGRWVFYLFCRIIFLLRASVVVHFLSTKPIRRKFDELPNYVPHCIIEIFKRVPVVFGSKSREKWDNNNKDRVSEREKAREKTYKISFTV